MEEIEQKTKELLWEGIAALNQQIKEEKAEREKPIREFNRAFQKNLNIFEVRINDNRFSKDKQVNTN